MRTARAARRYDLDAEAAVDQLCQDASLFAAGGRRAVERGASMIRSGVALTAEDMDRLRCDNPDCTVDCHTEDYGFLHLVPKCHSGPVEVGYDRATQTLKVWCAR